MRETLLIDNDPAHAERVIRGLGSRNLRIQLVADATQAELALRRPDPRYELIIINVSDPAQPWIEILGRLQQACREQDNHSQPQILCLSTRPRDSHFELEIERKGARYVFER